ncbi:MAG: radical SAM protein [Deinococcales bacterium]
MQTESVQALYIHVPFCPSICPYCDFHKMRRQEDLVKAYLKRFIEEAKFYAQSIKGPFKTIYFGGGTPSHLKDDELGVIIEGLDRFWGFQAEEITLEADPLTFDRKRLDFFKHLGFNRLSIGFTINPRYHFKIFRA